MTFLQLIQLFNIFVGLFLTATLMVFGWGLVVYLSRLGTWPSNRDEGIKILEIAVAMLFVLIALLAIVRFFEFHTSIALFLLALLLLVVIGFFVLRTAAQSGKKEGEEKH